MKEGARRFPTQSLTKVASVCGHRINTTVRPVALLFFSSALFLSGCGAAHDAAVGSYHVATAPFRLFHHPSPRPVPTGTTVTTVTTTRSAGLAQPRPSPVTALPPHRSTHYGASASPSPSPRPKQNTTAAAATPKAKSTPARANAVPEQSFPTAKPVPDKPGYVFSPSEPSKYVDVSGYAPGSKVKDPYSGKIFLVP